VGFEQNESDLFHGLSSSADPTPLVQAEPVTALSPEPSSWRFAARPAIERFRKWSTAHELPGLAAGLESDQSVVAGQPTQVLFITDDLSASPPEDLQLQIRDPWTAHLVESNSAANPMNVEVLAPTGARAPAVLTAAWNQNGRREKTLINLKPIPLAELREAHQAPGPDPFQRDQWAEATVLKIPHTLNWEGTAASDADSSATVHLRYTRDAFHALVNVHDDHVVSNIAPNDIRGHWRSDSIEICVDPEARSEHTLSTFKVGIFPFDTDGNVRAARDADARQGPIEQTAPGMQLASRRTPTGYEIATSIPWPLLGVDPRPGHLMGFNILIYDGDKPDAAVGENINKSRLAWSPQRGVQGRPEDWGRLRLRR
jgi:hypothetical protein